jgi:uncharacterized membrane protein
MKKESVLGFLKDNYLIILIFIAGVLTRFYDLGGESVWYDEAVSIAVSKLGFADIIKWVFDNTAETNPPFYYLVLSFWVPVFGDSEFIARVPSAVLGSLSVFAVYAVGKLLYNKKTGLIAALIVAMSVFHIRYAQEARGYTLMVCLMLVSYYCLLQLTIKNTRIYAVIYVASTALLVYTHYYGVMIILAQNIFCFTLLIRNKKIGALGIGGWFKLQVITALFLLPCFVFLAVITLKIQKGFWVPEPSSEVIWQYFTIYSGSIYLLILFLAFSLYSIIGLRKVKDSKRSKKSLESASEQPGVPGISQGSRLYMLLLWMLVPVLVPFLISLVSSPILIFRYTIGASLAFYLLASEGISRINNMWLIRSAAVLIIALSLINIHSYFIHVGKHQWREVMNDIEARSKYGDVIVAFPSHEKITAEYYSHKKGLRIIPFKEKFPYLQDLGNNNMWLVMHAHPLNRERTKQGLSDRYNFISERHYYRLDLFQLREKSNY